MSPIYPIRKMSAQTKTWLSPVDTDFSVALFNTPPSPHSIVPEMEIGSLTSKNLKFLPGGSYMFSIPPHCCQLITFQAYFQCVLYWTQTWLESQPLASPWQNGSVITDNPSSNLTLQFLGLWLQWACNSISTIHSQNLIVCLVISWNWFTEILTSIRSVSFTSLMPWQHWSACSLLHVTMPFVTPPSPPPHRVPFPLLVIFYSFSRTVLLTVLFLNPCTCQTKTKILLN